MSMCSIYCILYLHNILCMKGENHLAKICYYICCTYMKGSVLKYMIVIDENTVLFYILPVCRRHE